jgi:hypothetical protein
MTEAWEWLHSDLTGGARPGSGPYPQLEERPSSREAVAARLGRD